MQPHRLVQTCFGEDHRFRAARRVGDQPLGVQAIKRRSVVGFPGAVCVMQTEQEESENGLVYAIGIGLGFLCRVPAAFFLSGRDRQRFGQPGFRPLRSGPGACGIVHISDRLVLVPDADEVGQRPRQLRQRLGLLLQDVDQLGQPRDAGEAQASEGVHPATVGDPGRRRNTPQSALRMASTRSRASPKSIRVLSRKNSGFCTPA